MYENVRSIICYDKLMAKKSVSASLKRLGYCNILAATQQENIINILHLSTNNVKEFTYTAYTSENTFFHCIVYFSEIN